jgi:hypothetical protein
MIGWTALPPETPRKVRRFSHCNLLTNGRSCYRPLMPGTVRLATFKEDPAAYMRDRRARLKAEAERAVALGDTRKPEGVEAKAARKRALREAAIASLSTERPAAKPAPAPRVKAAIPLGRELTHAEKRDDAQLEAIEARGGEAEWTGTAWREADRKAPVQTLAPARPPVSPVSVARPSAITAASPAAVRHPPPLSAPSKGVSSNGHANRELTPYRPPLRGEIMPPPRSMIADGGTPPRRYAPGASVAEATAMIRAYAAQQARVNEDMSQRLAALESAKAETDRRLEAIERRRTGIVAVVQGLASIFSLV